MTDTLTPEAEAVRICRDLIRIDSSNYGDGSGPGERACAEYVMGELTEVGLDPWYVESEPGRANVIVRIEGSDRSRSGLAVHGHLDVVPASSADWLVDPFAAEVRDGCIWGRGAIDMKDMVAMILANIRHLARSGVKPPRDLVFCSSLTKRPGGCSVVTGSWTTTRTCSGASARRSARSGASASPSRPGARAHRSAPTSCRPRRRGWCGC